MASRDTVVLTVYAVAIIVAAITLHSLVNPYQLPILIVVVEGKSMLPTLWTGDIVFVVKKPAKDIREGDIIVYRAILDNHLVIHRVIKVNSVGGETYYVTKGDNNIIPDNFMPSLEPSLGIPSSRVVGVVVSVNIDGRSYVVRIPLLGYISILVSRLK